MAKATVWLIIVVVDAFGAKIAGGATNDRSVVSLMMFCCLVLAENG